MKRSNQSSEMNLIWKKDKLPKYSKESLAGELAAGDAGQCRLCGASDHLQHITNDRLDETIRLYFGVQVSPEGLICQSCVKCMKITEGFSALVHASFNKTISEGNLDSSGPSRILAEFSPGKTNLPTTSPQKEILTLLNTKLAFGPTKRRERRKLTKVASNTMFKKTIIACTVCGQKYPMIRPEGGAQKFVCSRCQKGEKDCKKNISNATKEFRCKIELKGKNRLNSLPKKSQLKLNNSTTRFEHVRYQCNQCPKKYAIEANLAIHTRAVHAVSPAHICSVCGKKYKSKESLDKHLNEHIGGKIFKCVECMRGFQNARALQTHFVYHDKQKKYFSS